jgi:parallel beta-helix repeat protein/predicted outer membrane repeat protein
VQKLLSIFVASALALTGIAAFPTQSVRAAGDFFFPENYNTLQEAIDAAEAAGGGTIHASDGIYTEKISLKSGVRVIADNIGGVIIDAADTGTAVTAIGVDNTAEINGIIITGGNSIYGAGMYNENSSPIIANCTFINNTASNRGGGIYNKSNSNPLITGCTFLNNSASNGGGMYNYENSSPVVTECTFSGNSTTAENGGGMINDNGCSPVITDCTFAENTAYFLGGGMYNLWHCSPIVTGCTFINNEAEYGGGIANRDYCNPVLSNCIFGSNEAVLRPVQLWGFGGVGGGVYNSQASPIMTNCIFSGNSAEVHGGGLYGRDRSKLQTTNCTFISNISLLDGSTLAFDSAWQSSPNTVQISNCIIWDDTNGIWNNDNSIITIACSDVQVSGGSSSWTITSATDGGGNIDENPLLDNYTLYLQADSPCIDAGSNDALPADTLDLDYDGNTTEKIPFDIDGNPRIVSDVVDMGAHEFQPPPNRPPDADADGPYWIDVGDDLYLDGTGSSDPDTAYGDSIVSYEWDLNDDGSYEYSGSTVTVPWSDLAGLPQPDVTIHILIRVTDSFGASDTDTTELLLFVNEPMASFTATPNPAAPNQTITFDAGASSHGHPGHSIVLYEWDFDSDGVYDLLSSIPAATHSYSYFGSYTATLRVTDDNVPARTDLYSLLVNVSMGNLPPDADAGGPYWIDVGDDLYLDGTGSSDPDTAYGDTIVSYKWDLDNDGEYNDATGETTTIVFNAPGVYTVGLKVTDSFGEFDTDTAIVEVLAVPEVMIETLGDDLDSIGLPEGTENSLTKSLDTAIKVLEDSNEKNDVAAINALKAFISKIEAQRGKKIAVEVADELITRALAIITALSEGT